ncbi:MAG: PEP/pyruvate-binding domain-containing protein, partial [Pyrinomonadaceae bacterium]
LVALYAVGMCCNSLAVITAQTSSGSRVSIGSRAEFDSLARDFQAGFQAGVSYPLPHVLFVIDRKDNNRIYYIDSHRYTFHKDFVNGTYLSLDRGRDFYEKNYIEPNRRFILGTVAYQTPVKAWTFEFWEGDLIPSDLIKLTGDIIARTFFAAVAFKPNSLLQEESSARINGLERILQSDITKQQEYQPLNVAHGLGRIHIIQALNDHVEIGFNEILVLNEVPVHLPPVAGIITTKPSTPLSHINLLARSWGVPNAYIKNAGELFRKYDGWWVSFDTRLSGYEIKRADINEVDAYQRRLKARFDVMVPHYDLKIIRLADLREQRSTMSIAYGAKSANLGEVFAAHFPDVIVPDGFTIPFYYYHQFIKENGIEKRIYELLNDQKFVHDPVYRREELAALRAQFKKGLVNNSLRRLLLRLVREKFAGAGVFVRSSTNSEDLPNFNGAGLYTTVPNARGDEELIEALKTVWASVWNFEAYEARERVGIDHTKVFMAVLIQKGINSESSGVMITTDPYNRQENKESIYISAKRGLGIKVVEGQKVAEQILFNPQSKQVKILTRSEEDSLLTFDEHGGVKEIPVSSERTVLSDINIRNLSRTALQIKRLFKQKDQDIEWALVDRQIYILQSRPYISEL